MLLFLSLYLLLTSAAMALVIFLHWPGSLCDYCDLTSVLLSSCQSKGEPGLTALPCDPSIQGLAGCLLNAGVQCQVGQHRAKDPFQKAIRGRGTGHRALVSRRVLGSAPSPVSFWVGLTCHFSTWEAEAGGFMLTQDLGPAWTA